MNETTERPQLVHNARESLLARHAKYEDPNNLGWEWEDASKFERRAISAVLDLVASEATVVGLRSQLGQIQSEHQRLTEEYNLAWAKEREAQQECDRLRSQLAEAQAEIGRLKVRVMEAEDPYYKWASKYDCYLKKCAYPGEGRDYRCDNEKGLGFPSHCSCTCHKPRLGPVSIAEKE